jgi:hypothetical protein
LKKLVALSKVNKGFASWTKGIINHLWYSCANCEEDENKLFRLWESMLHHVKNEHKWKNKKGEWESCQHEPLSEEHRAWTEWMRVESELKALEKVRR